MLSGSYIMGYRKYDTNSYVKSSAYAEKWQAYRGQHLLF